jgi:hypothetical protein
LRSTVPIVVGSTTVGRLITEESLDGFVKAVLLCVLASTVLAAAAYLGFPALPLRALDDTIAELETQNERFDIALSNMSQGLCVFDKDRRLVVCNSRYAHLYSPARRTNAAGYAAGGHRSVSHGHRQIRRRQPGSACALDRRNGRCRHTFDPRV